MICESDLYGWLLEIAETVLFVYSEADQNYFKLFDPEFMTQRWREFLYICSTEQGLLNEL